jgi:hypothetical protein
MPFIEGETLRDLITRDEQLPIADAVRIAKEVAAELRLGARRILFPLGDDLYLRGDEHYTPFDLSPDDQRFIMAREVQRATSDRPTIVLVENWFEELKAKVKP